MQRTPSNRPPARSRRRLAAAAAARLGLLRAARAARCGRGLLVLAYHRIGDPAACPLDRELFCATPRELESHARILRRWTRPLSLEEVTERYAASAGFAEPLSLVTFDDVYRDSYVLAFPVLRAAGLPAVFFAPTGLLERGHVPWWDRIAYAIRRARSDVLRLRYPEGYALDGLRADPEGAILRVLRRYKRDPDLDKERFVAALEEAAGARAAAAPEVGELFATWEELRRMAAAGCAIASHTHTHRVLGHLSFAEQCEELSRSREELIRRIGVEPLAVAYPVGQREHFNGDTRRALALLGYRLGFSHYGGWNPRPADPHDVRRVRVDRGFTADMLRAAAAAPALFAP